MRAFVQRVLPRAGLLLIPPLLFALQILVGLQLPRAHRSSASPGGEDGVAFSVISIEPGRSARQKLPAGDTRGPELWEGEERGARGYEDEIEMPTRQGGGWGLELQTWAAREPSFTAEVERIITYITTPQVNCSRGLFPGEPQASQGPGGPWLLCVDGWSLPPQDPACVAYSFSMDVSDAGFLRVVSGAGCEVHRFDPGSSGLAGSHGDRSGGNHSEGGSRVFQQHRVWLDWRATKGRRQQKRGILGSRSRTLEDIMAALGHHAVHFLYADLLSAEWRVLQNWAELGTLGRVHHLVATVHLQWAGFEVGGTDAEVVRYWFSVLRGLHTAGFRLVRSSPEEGQSVLRHHVAHAHSSYTLSWVNVRPAH